MKRRTERTSARVARTAGKILAVIPLTGDEHVGIVTAKMITVWFPWSDIRGVAASALTQVEDHAERETLRRGKLPRGHKLVKRHKPVVRNGRCGSDGPWTD